MSVNEEDKECPACGIFFSKWKEREENVVNGNLMRYSATLAHATSSEFNWTILLIFCAVMIGIFYLIGQRAKD